MDGTLLAATGLVKRYDGREVVDVASLDLRAGELLALFGPNGAGKSTLLRLLAMLEKPSAGRVEFRGRTGREAERALRRASSIVFQRPYFWRDSVEYNVALGLKLRRVSRLEAHRRVASVCESLEIGHLLDAAVATLSGGQLQRVSLARALVTDPEILFLDEPTANLDTDARADLRDDLERVARERTTSVFLITHDRNEAFHLADRVAVMREGRIVQIGTPTDIYENPVDDYTARLTGAEFTLPGRVVARDGATVRVQVGGATLTALGDVHPGMSVKIAYRPEDLVLGPPDRGGNELSTRNLLYATVRERRDMGGLVRLKLEGSVPLVALVTRDAADQLGLAPGSRVAARVKATALHAFPAAERARAAAEERTRAPAEEPAPD